MSKSKTKQTPTLTASTDAVIDKSFQAQLRSFYEKSSVIINRYFLLFAILISSGTIIIAILIAQHYINPTRDQATYDEGVSSITYHEIDQQKLQELQESLQRTDVEVGTEFVPNRQNPFSE